MVTKLEICLASSPLSLCRTVRSSLSAMPQMSSQRRRHCYTRPSDSSAVSPFIMPSAKVSRTPQSRQWCWNSWFVSMVIKGSSQAKWSWSASRIISTERCRSHIRFWGCFGWRICHVVSAKTFDNLTKAGKYLCSKLGCYLSYRDHADHLLGVRLSNSARMYTDRAL